MIKGCLGRMIVVKNTGSDLFEEAYFILKSSAYPCKVSSEKDFIDEANRIVSEACGMKIGKPKDSVNVKKRSFFAGTFVGFFVCAVLFLCAKTFNL